jgi:hypothetical protein
VSGGALTPAGALKLRVEEAASASAAAEEVLVVEEEVVGGGGGGGEGLFNHVIGSQSVADRKLAHFRLVTRRCLK